MSVGGGSGYQSVSLSWLGGLVCHLSGVKAVEHVVCLNVLISIDHAFLLNASVVALGYYFANDSLSTMKASKAIC